jgi:alcohol dehydrogenase class IV
LKGIPVQFEFATAGRIVFGPRTLSQAGKAAAALGKVALVITGRSPARAGALLAELDASGVRTHLHMVADEPTVEDALAGAESARDNGCQLVIGFGGGSALDASKAIAAFATNPGDPYDYLEVIGRALPLPNAPLPVIAIPTTAGTGSEVTRNAVLASLEHAVKVSVRSPLMLPRVAIVDPELTWSVPPAVTASTGLDALTQLIEPFVSVRATPFTDAICREAMPRAANALPVVYADGQNATQREQMAFASLCGGLALANAGLGAVHGFAGPFGGMYHAPHGAICAALLAPVTEANLAALAQQGSGHPALMRYREAAKMCTGSVEAGPADLVVWLRELARSLSIPGLSTYGFSMADAGTLIERALASSSMKGNPVALDAAALEVVLEKAL